MDAKNLLKGQEQYEYYFSRLLKRQMCQYDYRDIDGELFSTVASTLEIARNRRNKWLQEKYKGGE